MSMPGGILPDALELAELRAMQAEAFDRRCSVYRPNGDGTRTVMHTPPVGTAPNCRVAPNRAQGRQGDPSDAQSAGSTSKAVTLAWDAVVNVGDHIEVEGDTAVLIVGADESEANATARAATRVQAGRQDSAAPPVLLVFKRYVAGVLTSLPAQSFRLTLSGRQDQQRTTPTGTAGYIEGTLVGAANTDVQPYDRARLAPPYPVVGWVEVGEVRRLPEQVEADVSITT